MGRPRKRSTVEDYERLLADGFGTGEKENYLPWVRIPDFASYGVSAAIPGITIKRTHEVLSGLETRAFLIAEFNKSVIDIREQFPLFPVDHLIALAERAGIVYPRVSGTPYVLTTDLLLTIEKEGEASYLAVAVKPTEALRKKSVLDNLELERLWWTSLGVEWVLATETDLPEVVGDNLTWISHEFREVEFDYDSVNTWMLEPLASKIEPRTYMIGELICRIAQELNLDTIEAKILLCKAIWQHLLVIDLNVSIQKQGMIKVLAWNFSDPSYEEPSYENIA